MQRPLRRDAALRRAAILAAAEQQFAERGFDVPLEEICLAAGVGRGTLYRNFGSRDALLRALMERNIDELERTAHRIAGSPEGLWILLREVLDQLVTVGPVTWVFQTEPEVYHDIGTRFAAILDGVLEPARAAGLVAPDVGPLELQVVVRMMWGGLRESPLAERRARADTVFRLCVEGIAVRE